jgi:hypothetical protein
VNVVAAIAGVSGLFCEFTKLANFAAFRAPKIIAKAQLHQVRKARFLSRKLAEKVLDCESFCHGCVSYQ